MDIVNFLIVSRSSSFFILFVTVPALTPVFSDISFTCERESFSSMSRIFRSSLSRIFKAWPLGLINQEWLKEGYKYAGNFFNEIFRKRKKYV